MALRDALTTHHTTDAHAAAVTVPSEDTSPRLKKTARAALRGTGAALGCAFADLDRTDHAPWPDHDTAAAAVALAATLWPGAGVYGTRAGLRLVWALATPVPLAQARRWLAAWHAHCAADPATAALAALGLHLDDSAPQWTRGFRLPRVVRDGVALDPPMALDGLVPLVWSPPGHREDPPPPAVTVGGPLARVTVPDVVWSTLAGAYPDLDLRAGAPYAAPGGRNSALTAGIGRTVRLLADTAPDATTLAAWTVSAWWDSVAATLAAPGGHDAPTHADAWRLAAQFAASDHEPPPPAPDDEPTAADQDGPPVVLAGQRYHVLDTAAPHRGYGPGVPAVALPAELRQRAPSVPWASPRGVPYHASRILAHHGAVAHQVVAHYHRSTTTYADGVLSLGVCPRRTVTPREHPRVAQWLTALAGGEYAPARPLLLDWLATVVDLNKATAALYLRGEPDAGKTLFARGLAALWSAAPVSFAEVAGRWNGGLLTCPVVHLSEGHTDQGASTAFRRLTGDRVHRIERKFEALVDLVGHPRVVIGANNDDALPLGAGHHTRDDLEAIARRVLYLRATPRAAEILRDVDHTRWTDPDGPLPQHLAWLVATRRDDALTRADSRFLVRGVESPWHRSMLLRSGGNEGTLSAVATAVADDKCAAAVWHRGRVWANVSTLHALWRTLTGEDRVPTRAAVARTVRDLSPADRSVVLRRQGTQTRVWEIPTDLVLRVAENHGLACADDLRRIFALNARGAADGADAPLDKAPAPETPSVGNK